MKTRNLWLKTACRDTVRGLLAVLTGLLFVPLSAHAPESGPRQVRIQGRSYPLYPALITERPRIPSPFTTADGQDLVLAVTKDGKHTLIPVTIENTTPSDYTQDIRRKGRQRDVDAGDFPTLAATGLHSEIELDQTRTITGRSIAEITVLARPGQYSSAGFIGHTEDIISVLRGDNRLVKRLGLTHAEVVRPLFHVWNLVLAGIQRGKWTDAAMNIQSIAYHGREIQLEFAGRGFQESVFDDEIQGEYHLVMRRQPDGQEQSFLRRRYAALPEEGFAELVRKLSAIHTGDMVPYYAAWYGFYEGHTDFRADPLAVAFVFGLRSAEEMERAFPGGLHRLLTGSFATDRRWPGAAR